MEDYSIIIKPLVTEKTTHQQNTRNSYTFKVEPRANKPQIKAAIERLYQVKVLDVRTQTRKGKPRRTKHGVMTTGEWKRAIVKLHVDSKIDLF